MAGDLARGVVEGEAEHAHKEVDGDARGPVGVRYPFRRQFACDDAIPEAPSMRELLQPIASGG